MRKLTIAFSATATLLLAGTLAWQAEATPLGGAAADLARDGSLVEQAGCKGPGVFCPWGRHLVCPPYRTCWCAPCGAYKRPGGKWRD